jgi:hypothetical protein
VEVFMRTYLLKVTLITVLLATSAAGWQPARAFNISGTWLFSVDLEGGGHGDPTFVFKQQGDKLTGTYDGPVGHQDVTGTVTGNKAVFGFQASDGGETVKATYTATVESETKMSGTVDFNNEERGKWTAVRK